MSPPTDDRLYNRSFVVAFVSMLTFVLANCLTTHYARWISHLGGDVRQIGWITGGGAVVALLLRPSVGQAINRFGARAVWAAGIVLFGIGASGNLLVEELSLALYALRALLFVGAALVFSASLTYITLGAPPARRTEAIGTLGASGFLGMLTGPALGDSILGAASRSRADFAVLFVVATAALALPLLAFFLLPAVDQDRSRAPARRAGARGALLAWTGVPQFVRTVIAHWPGRVLGVTLAFGIAMSIPFVFLPEFVDLSRGPGSAAGGVSIFFLGYGGWGFCMRIGLRRLPERWGLERTLTVGLVLVALGNLSFLVIDPSTTWMLIIPGLLGGSGHALAFPTMTSLTLEPFPRHSNGTGSALSLFLLDLGMVGGAPLLGWLAASLGFPAVFATVAAITLAAAIFFVPRPRSRSAAREIRPATDAREAVRIGAAPAEALLVVLFGGLGTKRRAERRRRGAE